MNPSESSDVVRFDPRLPHQGQMRTAKLKSAYNSLVIGLTMLGCKTNLQEIMGLESSDVVIFDLVPRVQGQTRVDKLKSVYNSLVIAPGGLQCQTNLS